MEQSDRESAASNSTLVREAAKRTVKQATIEEDNEYVEAMLKGKRLRGKSSRRNN
jgi:hypothetical protein